MNFFDKLLGRATFKATEYISFSKPIDSETEAKLNRLIEENAHNSVDIGDNVCYLVDSIDIQGAENDPQRPKFDNAVVKEKEKRQLFSPSLVRIEQDKKSIWVLPQLLKKL